VAPNLPFGFVITCDLQAPIEPQLPSDQSHFVATHIACSKGFLQAETHFCVTWLTRI